MRPRHLPVRLADPGGAARRHFRFTPNSGHFSVQWDVRKVPKADIQLSPQTQIDFRYSIRSAFSCSVSLVWK